MDFWHNLALGFGVALTPHNLLCAFLGGVLGTLIGVLPGLGAAGVIAMLLPVVYSQDTIPALVMLAGIYYGAQYGASTTAILIRLPRASGSGVTAIDGYQMARQGRAGAALGVALLGSFFAGCVGTVIIAAFAPPLTALAFRFGPAEYFSLIVLGLVGAVVLASGSIVKALAMIVLGLLFAQVNAGLIGGVVRFSAGMPALGDGIGLVAIAMGLFGFGEVIAHLGGPAGPRDVSAQAVNGLWPTRDDLRAAWPAVVRGTVLGSLLGVLPGGGALLGSFASYAVEKQLAGAGGRFGRGDIRGVAGPESANNAGAQTSFIPMLALGIPPNAVMALMAGAMAIKGIPPGPQVMTSHPQLFWGLIASMWVGNGLLVLLNFPLGGVWNRLLAVPYRFVFPVVAVFCCVGVYSLSLHAFDVYLTAAFALVGYVFFKLSCEPAPLLLGFVLGPAMEAYLRQALRLAGGDWSSFVTRPLSAGLLATAVLMIAVVTLPSISKRREATFLEE